MLRGHAAIVHQRSCLFLGHQTAVKLSCDCLALGSAAAPAALPLISCLCFNLYPSADLAGFVSQVIKDVLFNTRPMPAAGAAGGTTAQPSGTAMQQAAVEETAAPMEA